MSVFSGYAKYYDLLYRDKDYTGEAEFIRSLLAEYAPDAKSVLELGCGTGGHAEQLARKGMRVHGVDLSEEMLRLADDRLTRLPEELAGRLCFEHGDIRSLDLAERFDAVLSLFHVISYQLGNEDLLAAFRVAKKHLQPDGVFIFDCWYGPGVLHEQPEVRVKRMVGEDCSVLRIAEPQMHPNDNIVDVNYQIILSDREGRDCESLHEQHRMRYLFRPELELLLEKSGLQLVEFGEWMTRETPGLETWAIYCVVQAGP